MQLNERFKKIRKDQNLSQAAFGKLLGVSRDVVNNVEQARARLADDTLAKLAMVFNVDLNWLVLERGEPYLAVSDSENAESEAKNAALLVVAELLDQLPDSSAALIRNVCAEYLRSQEKKIGEDSIFTKRDGAVNEIADSLES